MNAPRTVPPVIGISRRPASLGANPPASSKLSGTRMMVAIMTIDIEKVMTLATANILLPKRRSGIIGSRASLSHTTNTANSAIPITSGSRTSMRAHPPTASARPTAISIGVVEPRISIAPIQSIAGFLRGFAIARSFCPYRAGGRGPLSLARTVWAPPPAPVCRAARRRRRRSRRGSARRSHRGGGMDARSCRLRRNVARRAARHVSGAG